MSLKPFSLGVVLKGGEGYSFYSRRPSYAEVVKIGIGEDVVWTRGRWQRYISFLVLSGATSITRYFVLDIYHFQRQEGLFCSLFLL